MSEPGASRVDRWFSRPRAPLFAIGAGLVLALHAFVVGFFADDDALLAYLAKRANHSPPWYDLYRFTPDDPEAVKQAIAHGQFAWWTAPTLRLHLVRPLTSALFTLDHAIFGRSPFGYHVTSLLWWGALLVGVRLVYRRALPAPTGALALLLYAVADVHAMAYGWISARHMLVSAAPVVLGLAAAMRAREDGWTAGRWFAALGMIVGLAGGESALGGLAFWACYEVLGPPGRGRTKDSGRERDDRGARLARAALPAAIGALYLVAYALVSGGVHDSGAYVDPSNPRLFAVVAAKRFPALVADALVDLPAELAAALPGSALFVVTAAIASLAVFLLWRATSEWHAPEERAAVRWMLPGALLATLGAVGGFPGGRELVLPEIAWAVVFAVIFRHAFRAGGRARSLRTIGAGFFAVIHLSLSPIAGLGTVANAAHITRAIEDLAGAPPLAAGPSDVQVYFAQASDPMVYLYPVARMLRGGALDARRCFAVLSSSPHGARVTRTGDDTVEIAPLSGAFLDGAFEQLYRSPDLAMPVGYEADACGARVRVAAVDDRGMPTRIEARLRHSLDDERVRLVAWKDGAIVQLRPRVGEAIEIPWSRGPLGMF